MPSTEAQSVRCPPVWNASAVVAAVLQRRHEPAVEPAPRPVPQCWPRLFRLLVCSEQSARLPRWLPARLLGQQAEARPPVAAQMLHFPRAVVPRCSSPGCGPLQGSRRPASDRPAWTPAVCWECRRGPVLGRRRPRIVANHQTNLSDPPSQGRSNMRWRPSPRPISRPSAVAFSSSGEPQQCRTDPYTVEAPPFQAGLLIKHMKSGNK